ncbi:MFS general substrate transporter [Rhizoctonia solani]|uniref:MFS general substrate transporter n=1 Tax=Rhizoctonia solani TaxID=456999 RepID=A0A8H7MA94_9AGAM|nr:MFS general substrate transporter [Rhizoctonia solani]
MPGGPVAAQLDEQPLIVEHDTREDGNQPPLIVLTALNAVCPLAFELVYPFVNSMIVEIGVTDDPERVGFYSGLIESVFSVMSLIMIIPCGYVSDHVGRKPVVLLGLGGLSISIMSFGLSKSLAGMIMSRCIGGALGASWAAIKVMVGEMTDRSNQDTAFSMMNVSYRLGQIIGLPLGGLLAHPERRWKAFQTPFWNEYPFLLPCLVGAGFSLISVLFGILFIEETLPSKVKSRRKAKRSPYSSGSSTLPTKQTTPLLVNETELETNRASKKPTWRTVMTPSILSLVINNACMCVASEMLFSVYPLFAFTPIASGGLGMSEGQIGTQMSIRAVVHILMMVVYSKVNRALGTVRLYKVTMAFWSLVVLGFPFLHWVASLTGIKSIVFNTAQFIFFLAWSVCGFAWVCMGTMVNDASPSAEALSLINGTFLSNLSRPWGGETLLVSRLDYVRSSPPSSSSFHPPPRPPLIAKGCIQPNRRISQISIVLPQAISPALANSLFAVSVDKHLLGGNLVWVLLFVFRSVLIKADWIACLAFLHSLTLREHEDDWRTKQQDEHDD